MDSFGEDIVEAAFIADTFGGELNPNEGSYITRQKTKRIIKKWENKDRIPEIKMERIEHFTNEINNKIKKQALKKKIKKNPLKKKPLKLNFKKHKFNKIREDIGSI